MDNRQKNYLKRFTFQYTQLHEFENPVQRGLAVTPSEMMRMTEKGRPVSPSNIPEDMWSDDDHSSLNDFSVSITEKRGVTMSAVWEAQQDARAKFRKAKSEGAFKPKKGVDDGQSS